jgi:2-methylcitrate dehydratase PrpD
MGALGGGIYSVCREQSLVATGERTARAAIRPAESATLAPRARVRAGSGGMAGIAATAVERLAEWVVGVRADEIPEPVRARARAQIASVVAACHAGWDTEAGRAVHRAVSGWSRPGPCTVIPTGERIALHDAVLINAALGMTLDYDDYLYLGHTGHSAVLASLALCEQEGWSAEELLAAQVVANEIGGRIGASVVLGPQNGQAWSFLHLVEGAAVASRLLGLTAAQTAQAMAIALYQPTYTLWPGFMGPTSKVLTAAGPTVTGIQAASLAREGVTGAREILEHARKGFWKTFAFAPLPSMLGGLGEVWLTETLTVKPYPGCAYIDTAMDALFAVLEEFRRTEGRPLDPARVARVVVRASLLTVEMDNLGAEHDDGGRVSPVTANFSISLGVAIGLLAGRLTPTEMGRGFLDANERAIRDLAARVELIHDWGMSARVARSFGRGPLGPVVRKLRPRDVAKVVAGYRGQMGGRKKNPLRRRAMVPDLLRELRRRVPLPAGFVMTFPAEVSVTTTDGRTITIRRDVPIGAPGQERYDATADEKFLREVTVHVPAEQAERALAMVRDFERSPLGELMRRVCIGP